MQFMYTAGIVPFLFAATIVGAARFRHSSVDLSLWALVGCACLSLYSPIYFGARDVRAIGSPLVAAKSHALGLIPAAVPVSATNELGGHLSQRRRVYTFPKVGLSHWIVVDVRDGTYVDVAGFKRFVRKYESDKDWRTVYSSHGVTVLHKRPSTASS
jgi:hypothetical protein